MNLDGLERLRGGLAEAAFSAVEGVCGRIRDESAALCPVESGALRGSIRAETVMNGALVCGTVTAGEDYAAAVELGTYRQAAKPFLAPAFALHADGVISALSAGVSALV